MKVIEVIQQMDYQVVTVVTLLSFLQGRTLMPTRPHLLTSVECLREEASSQGMVVHSSKQLIEEARVIWKERTHSCRILFLFLSSLITNRQRWRWLTGFHTVFGDVVYSLQQLFLRFPMFSQLQVQKSPQLVRVLPLTHLEMYAQVLLDTDSCILCYIMLKMIVLLWGPFPSHL